MFNEPKVAVPVEIKLTEAEIGDTIRVLYVEQTDPEIPDSSATEISYTGVVHRLSKGGKNAGSPVIRLRNFNEGRWGHGHGYTEITLASAHTLPPTSVTLLHRPEKPFKLQDRTYYTGRTDGENFKYRWTVTDGRVVLCEYQTTTEPWKILNTDISDHLDEFLTKAILGTHESHEIIDSIPLAMVPGVTYEAKSRDTKKAQTIRFTLDMELDDFPNVDPIELRSGTGAWHYPVVYVNPRQAVIDRAKRLGVKPENIYGCFGREKYGVDVEGYTMYSSYNGIPGSPFSQYDLHRITRNPMEVLDGIENGYLVLERSA